MQEDSMQLEVVTVEGIFVSTMADLVVLPAKEGEVGIQKDHAPLISLMDPGVMKIVRDKNTLYFAVSEGFFEVFKNKVTVLAKDAISSADVNVEEIGQEKERAMRNYQNSGDESEKKRALYELKKCEAWIKAAHMKCEV